MFKSIDAQNASCNAVTSLVDLGSINPTGRLNIYDTTNTVLVQLDLSLPAFADAVDGTAVSNFITDSTVIYDGTATSFGVLNRDASTVWTGTVSDYAGNGDLKLNSIFFVKDAAVSVSNMVYVVPPEYSYFGATGAQGATGIMGLQGITGLRGVTGLYGQTGIRGVTGFCGVTGCGATGFQGPTGIRGVTGLSFNSLGLNISVAKVGGVPTGIMGYVTLASDATFSNWTLLTDATSTIKVDIQKSSYANYPFTISMHGSTGIFVNASVKNTGVTSAWDTTSAASGDIIKAILTGTDGSANNISLFLKYS